jgi:hypothetical protein
MACLFTSPGERTAGDLLRNFGAAHVVGARGAYERAVKLCYGLSILVRGREEEVGRKKSDLEV